MALTGTDADDASSARTYVQIAFALNEEGKYAKGPPPTPTPRALMPRWIDERFELSMFSIDNLNEVDIWKLLNPAAQANTKPIPARADYLSQEIRECGLETTPDWDPVRHVNVLSWPSAIGEQRQIVQRLVKLAMMKFPS